MSEWIMRVVTLALCAVAASAGARYQPTALTYDPARLHAYTTIELIDLLYPGSSGPASQEPRRDFRDDVADELVARRAAAAVVKAFAATPNRYQQYDLAAVLVRLHDPAADARLHRLVGSGLGDTSRIATQYFARRCETRALAILNRNFRRYPISSLEAGTIAEIFGGCRYRPAARQLAVVVDAASLNLADDAYVALTKLFPDAHIDNCKSPADCSDRWRAYVAKRESVKAR